VSIVVFVSIAPLKLGFFNVEYVQLCVYFDHIYTQCELWFLFAVCKHWHGFIISVGISVIEIV
jgi:hypothetical protein